MTTATQALPCPTPASAATRRRRLWELEPHVHCPVLGVCLPIALLRRLVDKVLGGQALADDYELHCGAIAACRRRGPIAEALQRELDRRFMPALRQAARAKSTEALRAWWHEASHGPDLAGAMWATLSHARCDDPLQQQVLGEVHMLQHQVGMARRTDLQRFEALVEENGVLTRELAAVQQRCTRQIDALRQRGEQQQGEIVQLRAQLIGRDTALAALRDELRALEAATPGLKSRFELARECERLLERQHALQRALLQAEQTAERERLRAEHLAAASAASQGVARDADAEAPSPAPAPAPPALTECTVLCVGGRPASVPVYRRLVEGTGGRFLHHDGGNENPTTQLDATLAAADLVICQTGCISHDAYWRVKDHCKRTGKRCVFVDTPSGAGLRRALATLGAPPRPVQT
jgi:hypothetical protein